MATSFDRGRKGAVKAGGAQQGRAAHMWVHKAAASISPMWQLCCPAAQIEARARQMEGRDLGQQAAAPGGKPPPGKYERGRQGAASGLLSEPKAYNPDADATATAGKEEKKKVSSLGSLQMATAYAAQEGQRGRAAVAEQWF